MTDHGEPPRIYPAPIEIQEVGVGSRQPLPRECDIRPGARHDRKDGLHMRIGKREKRRIPGIRQNWHNFHLRDAVARQAMLFFTITTLTQSSREYLFSKTFCYNDPRHLLKMSRSTQPLQWQDAPGKIVMLEIKRNCGAWIPICASEKKPFPTRSLPVSSSPWPH